MLTQFSNRKIMCVSFGHWARHYDNMVEFSEGADSTRLRKYFKQADDKLKNCQIIYIIIQLEKDSGSYCDLGCRT